MANYKVVDADQLDLDMKSVADAIRAKAGTAASMSFPDGYISTIRNIEEGADLPILVNPGTEADALKDKEFINQAGEIVTGSIVSKSAANVTVSGDTVNIPSGYYPEAVSKSVANVEQSTPEISLSSSGLITASSAQGSGYVIGGTKSATKQLSAKSAETFVPTTKNQTIPAGTYLSGAQTITGDPNLKAENIADGVTIFNIEGTHVGGIVPSGMKTVTENGVHDVTEYESVKVALPTATQATPSISVDSSGKITATVTQSTTGIVEKGTKTATKNLSTQAAKSITPTTSNQTAVSSGKYTTGSITVKGDANLVPGNIKSGTSIFGVTGSYTEPKPTGSLEITENGTYNVVDYASAIVNIIDVLPSDISAIKCGIFSSPTDISNTSYKITHNLGVPPAFFIVMPIGEYNLVDNHNYLLCYTNIYKMGTTSDGYLRDTIELLIKPIDGVIETSVSGGYYRTWPDNNQSYIETYDSFKLKANTKYLWIVGGLSNTDIQ